MIELCGEYYLDAKSESYTLKKSYQKRNGGTGYKLCSYHSRLEEALAEAVRRTVRDAISKEELLKLDQILPEIQRLEEEMRGLLQYICSARINEKSSGYEPTSSTENKCA